MTDTVSDMLQQLAADGWAGLENLDVKTREEVERQSAAVSEERQRQVKIARAALDTPDGRAFMEILLKMTVLRPATDEERMAPTAERYAILKAQREGQNNLVFTILGMLAEARGEERQPGGEL